MESSTFTFNKIPNDWPSEIKEGNCLILMERLDLSQFIFRNWYTGRFEIRNKLEVFSDLTDKIPEGLYKVKSIKYYKDEELIKQYFEPYNLNLPVFLLKKDKKRYIGQMVNKMAAKIINILETQYSIGNKDDLKEEEFDYLQFLFFCDDALITKHYRIGPAEIIPCNKLSTNSRAKQIRGFLSDQGFVNIDSKGVSKYLSHAKDKLKRCFVVYFPRVYIKPTKNLFLDLKPYLKKIFGIIALNRGAYPVEKACVIIRRYSDHTHYEYHITESYYRGNLIGGSISGENPKSLNVQYEELEKDPNKREILDKYRYANRELDLDYAYLRYWSILESIVTVVYNKKPSFEVVKNLVNNSYGGEENAEIMVQLKLGDESFDFITLLRIWYNFRNYTAHNGGLFVQKIIDDKIYSGINRLLETMNKLNMPFEYGEDRSLMKLQDVVKNVVKKYISGSLKV